MVRHDGRLDVLVNNAAFQVHAKNIEDLIEDHFDLTWKPTSTAISLWRRQPYRM